MPLDSLLQGQDGTWPMQSGGPEKLADLGRKVTELSTALTITTADENFKVAFGGRIVGEFLFNSARPVAPGIPFFLAPRVTPRFKQSTFDATGRQTALFALISGPEFHGFETGGLIAVILYNSSLVEDLWGVFSAGSEHHFWNG
jgi:hypothetical protein